jgi:type I restriction enzyme S subunit
MGAKSPRQVLGDYFTLQRGTTYKSQLLGLPGPVLLGLASIQRNGGFRRDSLQTYGGDSPEKLLVQPGDLYLSLKDVTQSGDLLGAVARLPFDHPVGRLTQDTVKLEPRTPDVPIDYLYWVMRTPQYRTYCRSHATGTTNLGLARDDFLAYPAPEPTVRQLQLVQLLAALDDKIELNRRMSETLEAMARALFKSWFVDFDPVRAKAEGRDSGLPKPLADLFPARLVDSELGELPEGWGVATLPELIEVNPSRPLRKGQIAPYLDMANMPTRGHAPDEVIERPFGSGMRFINGDTLVARITPCLENGKTAFVDFLQDGQVAWGSTEYIVLRPRAPLPDEFAYCLARSDSFREFAIQSMTGTSGRQRVPADSLAHYRLPRVPERVAEAFGRAVKPLFARSSTAARESRPLAALRDTLLPKLISGELRIEDAEKFIGRAV